MNLEEDALFSAIYRPKFVLRDRFSNRLRVISQRPYLPGSHSKAPRRHDWRIGWRTYLDCVVSGALPYICKDKAKLVKAAIEDLYGPYHTELPDHLTEQSVFRYYRYVKHLEEGLLLAISKPEEGWPEIILSAQVLVHTMSLDNSGSLEANAQLLCEQLDIHNPYYKDEHARIILRE